MARANLIYHGVRVQPVGLGLGSTHAAALARLCNRNATTSEPAWPALPMPQGTTCVTHRDVLKWAMRPPVEGEGGMLSTVSVSTARKPRSPVPMRLLVTAGNPPLPPPPPPPRPLPLLCLTLTPHFPHVSEPIFPLYYHTAGVSF